ncbi:MAG TPA: hypothetical protein VFJ58_03875 [Armatimonadota bacterium]|nr:hypothetical protein [Armatimonadota bacterium]
MRFWYLLCGAALFLGAVTQVQAYPIYAQREGKTCAYCHTNPAGGGPLTYRGTYYHNHNHSFAGFVDKGSAAPGFNMAWQMTLGPGVTRVGVGDTAGDTKLRLVTVSRGKTPESRVLTVSSWDKDSAKLVKDAEVAVAQDADRMEIGRFTTDKSVVIAMPSGYVRYDGKGYTYLKGAGADGLVGAVRLKDGVETFVTLDGEQSAFHEIDPKAAPTGWLVDGPAVTAGTQPFYLWGEARGPQTPDIAEKLGVPGDTTGLSLFGVWDPTSSGQWYYYLPEHVADGARKGDYVELYAAGAQAANPPVPAWTSPKLSGAVVDIAEGPDLEGGKQPGLYVLTDGSPDGAGQTLSFFALK